MRFGRRCGIPIKGIVVVGEFSVVSPTSLLLKLLKLLNGPFLQSLALR